MHRKVAAALVVALTLGVASCGGADALSRGELRSQLQAACRQAQQRAEQAGRKLVASGRRGPEALLQSVAQVQQGLLDRVSELNPPEELQDAFDAFEQGLQDRQQALETALRTVRARGAAAMQDLEDDVRPLQEQITRAVAQLDVEGCN